MKMLRYKLVSLSNAIQMKLPTILVDIDWLKNIQTMKKRSVSLWCKNKLHEWVWKNCPQVGSSNEFIK